MSHLTGLLTEIFVICTGVYHLFPLILRVEIICPKWLACSWLSHKNVTQTEDLCVCLCMTHWCCACTFFLCSSSSPLQTHVTQAICTQICVCLRFAAPLWLRISKYQWLDVHKKVCIHRYNTSELHLLSQFHSNQRCFFSLLSNFIQHLKRLSKPHLDTIW